MALKSLKQSLKREQKEIEKKKQKMCRITYTCTICGKEEGDLIKADTLSLDDLRNANWCYGDTIELYKTRKHPSLEECIMSLHKLLMFHTHSGGIVEI